MNVCRILTPERRKGKPRQVIDRNCLADGAIEDRVSGSVIHVLWQGRCQLQDRFLGSLEDAVQTTKHDKGEDNLAIFGLPEITAKRLSNRPDE